MAAVAPVPCWPPPPLAPPAAGLLAVASPSASPDPQTLPFVLPPAGYPLFPSRGPVVLHLVRRHPDFLAEVDRRRSSSLVEVSPESEVQSLSEKLRSHSGLFRVIRVLSTVTQFLKDEGAIPSPEDEKRREKVIQELKEVRDVGSKKETCEFGARCPAQISDVLSALLFPCLSQIVMQWAKSVAREQSVPQRLATATVLTYGSYTLGAHGPESDIDVLCVGPCIATLQYHFFVVLRQILEGRPEVSGVQTVESAKVPLMRFRFAGIAIDLTYAQLPVIDASKASRFHWHHNLLLFFG
ncbi:hypothetical protein HU200_002443 [Digitaria exilis]|uniref:Poly(A) polymerase nucleotidyltransferase domain-containing protein n=1 Tax=Digitaria exilis TaxID=1010633 RepID=A0A835FZK8_9POAL|nr:hypothetical protein HU200_002443 [Digitaria exilis]